VEAVTIISAFISIARAITIALARSLKEPVGFLPSSLIQKSLNPNAFLIMTGVYKGVKPTVLIGVPSPPGSLIGNNGKYRQRDSSRREIISEISYFRRIVAVSKTISKFPLSFGHVYKSLENGNSSLQMEHR